MTVTNTGTTAATVSGVSATGPFTETNNCSTLAVNASCTVNATYTPTAGGAQTGTLTVTSNANNSPTTATLSGTGISSTTNLALQPGVTMTANGSDSGFPATNANDGNTGTYWEGVDGSGYPQTLTANLTQSYPLGSVTLDLPPSTAWATRTQTFSVLGSANDSTWTTLVPSATYTFNPSTGNTVTFSLPSGTNDQYLELDFSANSGWSAAQISEFEIFPGSGGGGSTGSATLSASPTSVSFASQAVGSTSAAQTVTISNTGTAAASVSSITAGSPFGETNTCGSSIAAGGSCTASVTFTPTAAGAASASLTVASNATDASLAVALSGTGTTTTTSLPLTASPTSESFGSVAVGSTSTSQAVTVSNPGTAAASMSSVGVTGPFTEANNCGTSLAAGATCTVNVTFAPTAAGSATGTLSVNSSAPGSPLTVALSGTGTATSLPLTASPTSESFGSVAVGSTSTAQAVTVSNPGTAAASMSSVGVTGPFTEANNCGTSLAAGATCTVNVTFAPTAAGSATGTLSVNSSAPGSPLTVALSGTGTSSGGTSANLALNAPITASSTASGYPAGNANDGNTSTYWEGTNGVWPTTLTANLGAADPITSVVVDLPPATAWSTRTQTLSVLGSANGTTFTTIVPSATYTWNPSTGNTVTIALPAGTTDQYVELSFTANSVQNGAQASEFQVWGTSTALPDLALNAAVTASSTTSGYPATNAVDGNTSTYWEGTNGVWPTTLTANLGSAKALGQVVLDLPPATAWSTRTQTLSVLGSTNGTTFTTIVPSATYTWNPSTGNTVTIALPAGTTDQYLELSFTANSVQNGAQISELDVYAP